MGLLGTPAKWGEVARCKEVRADGVVKGANGLEVLLLPVREELVEPLDLPLADVGRRGGAGGPASHDASTRGGSAFFIPLLSSM
jgi:hypothetical protein